MSQQLVVALAQINFLVGDIPGHTQKIIDTSNQLAKQGGVDMVLFSELSLTGYPPEDLLLRPSLKRRIDEALARLKSEVTDGTTISSVVIEWRCIMRCKN